MLTYIDEQVANMRSLGYTKINWKGLFVVTGESDCNNHNWLVDERLLTIQQSLEEDLGVSSLPLTYSLLKDNLVDSPYHEYSQLNFGAGIINDEVSELASIDPDIAVTVSNADLDTRYTAGVSITDGIHYSADAYAAIGNRLFEAYMDMNYLPGDANSDGFVDGLDAQALASNWLKSDATWTMGDFDEDHFVGPKDATILATNWRLCPGDANSDGYINELDSQILASNWLAGDATWEMGDFDGDGTVGPKDATIMAANWTIIPRLFGDANSDGFVNGLDAHILELNWLAGDATWEMGDFDGDGIVGPKDATIMAANWRLCPGDANSDGFINELDAQILESNWLAGDATWKMGDFDGDGIVGPKDATIMAANWSEAPSLPGDANSDGVVNELDAQTLAANWLTGDATWEMGDFDGDHVVGPKDATIMAANWSASPTSSVPEPSMLVYSLVICLCAFMYYLKL